MVVTRYREPGANLRTTFEKIILRAGLKPWPKLFQNLRSTRQTELAETFPAHVVCAWIGNSESVARKHYLQVTDDHFALRDANCDAASSGQGVPGRATGISARQFSRENRYFPKYGRYGMGDEGLEPPTSTV